MLFDSVQSKLINSSVDVMNKRLKELWYLQIYEFICSGKNMARKNFYHRTQ